MKTNPSNKNASMKKSAGIGGGTRRVIKRRKLTAGEGKDQTEAQPESLREADLKEAAKEDFLAPFGTGIVSL